MVNTEIIHIADIREVLRYTDGLKAVVFDLDDTLYAEKEFVRSGFAAVSRMFPGQEGMAEELWRRFRGYPTPLDEVLAERGLLEYKKAAHHEFQHHMPDIHPFEGVRELISTLKQQGLAVGLISDGLPQRQRRKLLVLNPGIEHAIFTDELGGVEFRKPCPLAFERMAEELGVPYEAMAYVGDNLSKDFIAPLKLGMRSLHLVYPDGIYFGLNDQPATVVLF